MDDEFIKRLEAIVGPEHFDAVCQSFRSAEPVVVRANTLKSTIQALKSKLKQLNISYQEINGFSNSLMIKSEDKARLTHSDFYTEGNAYMQSLSSQLPPMLLDPAPFDEVLDLCAAPGSKTSHLAAMMNNQGRIGACEKAKTRFFTLKDNLTLLGASCVDTYLKDGGTVGRACPNRFDHVLVDAPCSSEGRFCQDNSKTWQYWSLKKIKEMQKKQWLLLQSGFLALKPGGTLVYSTCTFAPEENEMVVSKLLKRYDNAELVPMDLPEIVTSQPGLKQWQNKTMHNDIARCQRILPNAMMPGFFIAKFKKTS